MFQKKSSALSTLLGAFLLVITDTALAQAGGGGGGFLAPVGNTLQQFIDGFIYLSALIAAGIVLWQILEWAFDRKTFADIIGVCLKAIFIGGGPLLAKALWSLGQNMSWL